ncbi:hypothetical protein ACFYUL_09895 [Streptomyces sp. NPDC004311]|uniref:hypothetical protein n=1 Tax=Streptomyces sp. NPDC004311 TaxID=3364698 RepID=UPI0036963872
MVGNHLLQHPGLSAMAIGLAAHIQSLPEGAPVGVKVLAGRFPEGEIRIAAALRELERHGYLERRRERLASGRVVTRTYFHNKPGAATPDEGPGRPPRGGPEAGVPDHRAAGRPDDPPPDGAVPGAPVPDGAVFVGAVPGAAASDAAVFGTPVPVGAVFVGAVPGAAASDVAASVGPVPGAPVLDDLVTRAPAIAEPAHDAAASGVPVLDGPGLPGAAGAPRVHRPPSGPQFAPGPVPPAPAPAFPLTAPEAAAPPHAAAELLAGLRRRDPRLLLAERDVARLAPGVVAWLERGLDAEAVARALSRDLPEPLRNPAGVLAYRLGALLPPRLPPLPGPAARPHPDRITYPMQNCDGCDRGFRAPEPGRCGDCPQVAA